MCDFKKGIGTEATVETIKKLMNNVGISTADRDIAKYALENNVNVIVEKPATTNLEDLEYLINLLLIAKPILEPAIERDFEKWIGQDVVIVPQKFVEFRKDIRTGETEIDYKNCIRTFNSDVNEFISFLKSFEYENMYLKNSHNMTIRNL